MNGGEAASVDELIAGVDRGLYVCRLHYVNGLLEPRRAVMTGLTRDGCFLVEKGKIARAVGNLRFTDSLLEALARMDARDARAPRNPHVVERGGRVRRAGGADARLPVQRAKPGARRDRLTRAERVERTRPPAGTARPAAHPRIRQYVPAPRSVPERAHVRPSPPLREPRWFGGRKTGKSSQRSGRSRTMSGIETHEPAESADAPPPVDADGALRQANDAKKGDSDPADAPASATEVAAKADADEKKEPPLLTPGNPLRWKRGGITAAVGSLLAFLLMASTSTISGASACRSASCFVSDRGVGADRILARHVRRHGRARRRLGHARRARASARRERRRDPRLRLLALARRCAGLVRSGSAARSSPATFLGWSIALYRLGVALGPWATDEAGLERPLLQRHGFWLVVASARASTCRAWGATRSGIRGRPTTARSRARSSRATTGSRSGGRRTAGSGRSRSSTSGSRRIVMATLGVHYQPDQMLPRRRRPRSLHPEWVVRAPIFLLTIVAIYLLYKGVAKVFGRRAGLLGGARPRDDARLVLPRAPDDDRHALRRADDARRWGSSSSARTRPRTRRARLRGRRLGTTTLAPLGVAPGVRRRSSSRHSADPLPLLAQPRARALGHGPLRLPPALGRVQAGSAAATAACPATKRAAHARRAAASRSGATSTTSSARCSASSARSSRRCRRSSGAASSGPALPQLGRATRASPRLPRRRGSSRRSRHGQGPGGLRPPDALRRSPTSARPSALARAAPLRDLDQRPRCIVLAVALPVVRRDVRAARARRSPIGSSSTTCSTAPSRHVHDTNEGDDTSFRFYIWQLGYALFPWTGLAPVGLVYWLRRTRHGRATAKGDVGGLPARCGSSSRSRSSRFMGTKFHHYIFPAVPPVAMLVGVALDDMLEVARCTSPGAARS